ncbi:MAG: heavy-metal-associated domain-containing protein [Candidatus Altiarchaeota archaeon]|nr:heavy-metal-associated domain-containing protein [Candidatus Altiarchaeota archaeon]
MAKIQLKVTGMHCESCEKLIVEELSEIQNISKATADHKKGIVTFETTGVVDESKVKEKIRELGYEVA